MSDIDEIRSALSYLDPHDRDNWWQIGAAVKDELGENGFDMWDEWSQRADNYSARAAKATWKSLKPGIWHIETVWKLARQNGWKPERPYTPPSAEEAARRRAESEARRQTAEAERQAAQQKAQGTAQAIWRNSRPAAANHPYLLAKGITDTAAIAGLRQSRYKGNDNLLIPVLYGNQIVNLQSINQDGGKRFLSGGRLEGGYAFIGRSADVENGVVMAEGWATAASIHQATGRPVIVAFNAGNMVTVAERLAQTLPEHVPVVIAVDNDASQTGIKKAQQAAAFFNGRATAVQPEFTMTQIQQYQKGKGADAQGRPPLPSDFNDLHQLAGIEAVRDTLSAGFRRPEPPSVKEPDISEQEQQMKTETQAAQTDTQRQEEPEWKQKLTPEEQAATEADVKAMAAEFERENAKNAKPNGVEFDGLTHHHESEFSHYELHDATTDIMYSRRTPEEIRRDLNTEGTLETYFGLKHNGERVAFHKTEQGWEAPQKDKQEQTAETGRPSETAAKPEAQTAELPHEKGRKVVLDLQYRIPEHLKPRYHAIDGKFYSAADGKTVLFEDRGRQLKTALQDPQTVKDMLEVVKAKGWDSIKLSGSKEFKQMMFVEAAAQGIKTKGYTPTQADLHQVEALRERYAKNGIEPELTREQERQATKPEAEREERVRTEPDRETLSAAERLKAQSVLPSEEQINASPRADTDIDVPVHNIGQEEVPAEVLHQTDNMKAAAQDTRLVSAKNVYMQKAQKLGKAAQQKLAFYERGVMDTLRGLEGKVRNDALRNYYEHTANAMKGSKLDLPQPIQIPTQTRSSGQKMQHYPEHSREQEQEISR